MDPLKSRTGHRQSNGNIFSSRKFWEVQLVKNGFLLFLSHLWLAQKSRMRMTKLGSASPNYLVSVGCCFKWKYPTTRPLYWPNKLNNSWSFSKDVFLIARSFRKCTIWFIIHVSSGSLDRCFYSGVWDSRANTLISSLFKSGLETGKISLTHSPSGINSGCASNYTKNQKASANSLFHFLQNRRENRSFILKTIFVAKLLSFLDFSV